MAVKIDEQLCNGVSACPEGGLCIITCPTKAVEDKDDKPKVKIFSCVDCGLCVTNCPNQAIIPARRS